MARYRAHPVLTNGELAERRSQRLQAQRESMGPQEIGHLMRRTAAEALARNGTVEEADFLRANVPLDAIKRRGKAIIQEVVDARSRRGVGTDKLPVVAVNWDRGME